MLRPAGVVIAASFLGFFAVIGAFLTLVFIQVCAKASLTARYAESTQIICMTCALISAAMVIYSVCVVIGLVRAQSWARLGGIAFGILLAALASIFLIATTVMFVTPQFHQHPPRLSPGVLEAELCYLIAIAFSIWLALYLNSNLAKNYLRSNYVYTPDTIAYPAPPFSMESFSGAFAVPSMNKPAHGCVRISVEPPPAAIQNIAIPRILVLVFCAIGIVTSIYILLHAFSNKPYILFGLVMHDKLANAFRLGIGTTFIALSAGILFRYVYAYYAMLIMQILNPIAALLMLIPSYRARLAAYLPPAKHYPANVHNPHAANLAYAIQLTSFIFGVIVSIAFAWALWLDLAEMKRSSAVTAEPDS